MLTFSFLVLLSFLGPAHATTSAVEEARNLLMKKYFLPAELLQVDEAEVELQVAVPGQVNFAAALDQALQIFLNSTRDDECPLAVLTNHVGDAISGIDGPGELPIERSKDRALGALLFQLNSMGGAVIRLVSLADAPEGREPGYVRENWVFALSLRNDPHSYWAVIERQGRQRPFCYGFD